MQRDMDLVRKILLYMEEQEHAQNIRWKFDIEGYTAEQIGYHAHLMEQAGLIFAARVDYMENLSPSAKPLSLTWAGHDFLEATKPPGLWERAKKTVIKPAGGVAFSVLLDWLKVQAAEALKLP